MTGTEKQIKWAEDIEKEAIETIDANIKANQKHLEVMPSDFKAAVAIDLYTEFKAMLEQQFANTDSAAEIIDHRNSISGRAIVSNINDMAKQMEMQKLHGYTYNEKTHRMEK